MPSSPWCPFCPHDAHPIGPKCNVKRPYVDDKPCGCRGKRRLLSEIFAAIGDVLGIAIGQ